MFNRTLFLLLALLFICTSKGIAITNDEALVKSVRKNDLVQTRYALDRGANVNVSGPGYRNNPLGIAVENEHVEMIQLLLIYGANPNRYIDGHSGYNSTPLQKAIEKQNLTIIKILVKAGADVNQATYSNIDKTKIYKSPLICAIEQTQSKIGLQIINYLLKQPVEVNFASSNGYTALMATANCENLFEKRTIMYTVAIKLLKKGADPLLRANNQKTAIRYAMENEFTDMVNLLVPKTPKVKLDN